MEHLAATLKRGGIKSCVPFFPPSMARDNEGQRLLEEHFNAQGLGMIAEFYKKRQVNVDKEETVMTLKEMCDAEETPSSVSTLSMIAYFERC